MTILRPCLHCHRRHDCEAKRDKHKALRGLRLTLVNFKCDLPKPDFRPGERVQSELTSYDDSEYGPTEELMRGTVLRWKGTKVLVQFDEAITTTRGAQISVFGIWPDRLAKIDEPRRRLCYCGFVQIDGDCCPPDLRCWQAIGGYARPDNVRAAVDEAAA